MLIKCIVAGTSPDGRPDFFTTTILCRRAQFANGDHYESARSQAAEDGFEGEMVVFDERDGPSWLFEQLFDEVSDEEE